jgi:hypothetical protein
MGGPHDKNKTTLSAWIHKDKRDALRKHAAARNVSVATVLEELIDERISHLLPEKKKQAKGETENKTR